MCSLLHSQYVTAVPWSHQYTPTMITLSRPTPLPLSLPDLQNWKFSSQIFLLQLTDKLKVVREQVSCEGDRDDGVEAGEEMVEEVEVITGWVSYKVSIIG